MSKLMLKHEDLRFSLQVFQWKIVDTFYIEKWSAYDHTYLGFTRLLEHLQRKWEQFCNLGSVSDIMNRKYTNKVDFWFSICTTYIITVSSVPGDILLFIWYIIGEQLPQTFWKENIIMRKGVELANITFTVRFRLDLHSLRMYCRDKSQPDSDVLFYFFSFYTDTLRCWMRRVVIVVTMVRRGG